MQNMGKTVLALALLLIFVSPIFAINATASVKDDDIVFVIDGEHYVEKNLTIFVLLNGTQVRGVQKNNVMLPYYFHYAYEESGEYSANIRDEKGGYATASVAVASAPAEEEEKRRQEEQSGIELALIAGLIGLLALAFLLVKFIKSKSYNK